MATYKLSEEARAFAGRLNHWHIPVHLQCAVCHGIADGAVQLPCCGESMCSHCKTNFKGTCCFVCIYRFDLKNCIELPSLQLTAGSFIKNEMRKAGLDTTDAVLTVLPPAYIFTGTKQSDDSGGANSPALRQNTLTRMITDSPSLPNLMTLLEKLHVVEKRSTTTFSLELRPMLRMKHASRDDKLILASMLINMAVASRKKGITLEEAIEGLRIDEPKLSSPRCQIEDLPHHQSTLPLHSPPASEDTNFSPTPLEAATKSFATFCAKLKPKKCFDLPAEIRNRIYEYALLQPGVIPVTQDLRPPALLAVCTQIRKEAHSMWFRQNTFRFVFTRCEGKLYLKWSKAFDRAMTPPGKGSEFNTSWEGPPDWENLIRFMAETYKQRCTFQRTTGKPQTNGSNGGKTICRIQAIVCRGFVQRRKWEDVLEDLKDMREIAGGDRMWQ